MQQYFRYLTGLMFLIISLAAWWFTVHVINPELHYFLQQSAFLTNRLFFLGYIRYPGGVADYLSEFISQFFYYKIFGSLLIVLVASMLGIIAIKLIKRIAAQGKLNFMIFSLILLLSILVQCNYYYPFYASIRLLITFAFIGLFTDLIIKFPRIRFLTGFLLAFLLFYLAGGAALFAFAVSAILMQLWFSPKPKDLIILPFFIVFCGFLPFIAYKYFFLVDFSLVYSITHSKTPLILRYLPDYKIYALYSILPAYILCAIFYVKIKNIFKRFHSKVVDVHSEKGSTEETIHPGKNENRVLKTSLSITLMKIWKSPVFVMSGQLAVILVLSIYCLTTAFDQEKKNQLLVSFYGANGDWDNVIKTAKTLQDYDIFVNFEYNKALANKGKLEENLLNYKQLAGSSSLFLDGAVTSDVPFICSDQYYDLGFMHESLHWTFEAQTIFPNSPRLMKRLVQINLVRGKYELAQKFLNRLNDNMLYHDWVASYQKYINDTSLVTKDPVFSWKRKCEPREAFTASSYVQKLDKLLEANPANRMAYEYLLCSFLLDGDLGTLESSVRENDIFPKYPLPRSWEEALILYYYMAGKMPVQGEIKLSKEKQVQFVSFLKAIKPFGNDWQSARRSLEKEFGTSYWYYVRCLSPRITKAQVKKQKDDD